MIATALTFVSLLGARPVEDALPRRGVLGASFAALTPEQRTQFSLEPGVGMLVQAPQPGLSAEKLGLKAGDIVLSLNGKAVGPAMIGETVRNTPAGTTLAFEVLRDGKKTTLTGPLVEKPRDPGNGNYTVEYRHVLSNGTRIRTIITHPKKPGKYPALLFIQGFSPISYDYTLATAKGDLNSLDGPILFKFANENFVTMRVEKMGVGDSEGGPFAGVDYTTELDIYRQGLKQLKEQSDVDPNQVILFGHSMGGAFGPMIAAENPVRGIAVYGTATRTWHEYILETIRTQSLLAGATPEEVDDSVRMAARIVPMVFGEGMDPAEVKKKYPELAAEVDGMMPGGLYNGKTPKFWAQLGQINFPSYWAKVNCRVLSVRGASDFVTYDIDHTLIADVVNRVHPGWGKFVSLPKSDHLFDNWATEKESQVNWPRGTFNPAFGNLLMSWSREVLKSK